MAEPTKLTMHQQALHTINIHLAKDSSGCNVIRPVNTRNLAQTLEIKPVKGVNITTIERPDLTVGHHSLLEHHSLVYSNQRDCPSGQLSKKKFIEVYSGFFPDGNAEEFCTHVFRTFDKDNSGRIDFKEFLLAINITSGGDPEEKLEWAYQMYDIDGNGTIERIEMVEIISAIYSMLGTDSTMVDLSPEARAEEIFDKMDANGDGVLTRDEFMKGCMEDSQLKAMLLADEPVE